MLVRLQNHRFAEWTDKEDGSMSSSKTVVHGGEVVTTDGRIRADVLIVGERIQAVGLDENWLTDHAIAKIDASGCLLLPGGIDTHTHLQHMVASGNTRTADDFYSGTVAAACGGTTTIVDFVRRANGETIAESFYRRRDEADASCVIDFSFHPIVPSTAGEDDSFDELVKLSREEGVASWKFFMAYPGSMVEDDVLLEGFRLCAAEGVLPMVHAENGHIVADSIARLIAEGRVAENEHLHGHPEGAEVEAVGRAILLAEHAGTPLFIVHVSSSRAATEVARHRYAGAPVFAETCPQYLVTSYEDYSELGFGAAGYACSPPIRERANQAGLWHAISTRAIDTMGTDHAAFTLSQPEDLPPQKSIGRGYFPSVPNGVPGVEERLMVLYQAGVVEERISLERFVELTSTMPAKIFGLFPQKGVIAPGSDADIVVWDTNAARRLSAETQHSRSDYSLYEGMTVSATPKVVLSRGEIIAIDGEPAHIPVGQGRYLRRDLHALRKNGLVATTPQKGH